MKKFNSFFAIATVALTSVFGFTSCDKNEDAINEAATPVQPKQEQKAQDEFLSATLTYNYSQDAIDMFDINYEITDFDGTVESFMVTEAGKHTKNLKSNNLNAAAKVKTTFSAKSSFVGDENKEYNVLISSIVTGFIGTESGISKELNVYNDVLMRGTAPQYKEGDVAEFVNQVQKLYAGNYEVQIKK